MEISTREFNIGELDVTEKCRSFWMVGDILSYETELQHLGSEHRQRRGSRLNPGAL